MKNTRKRRKTQLKILIVLLLVALAGAAATIYMDYQARPGFLEKVWISDRGADYLTVAWGKVRNVDKYVVMYNGKTVQVNGRKSNITITGLDEDTYYEFSVRADSKEREGFETLTASAKTKKNPHITGENEFIKFANRPVDLKQKAEVPVTYAAGDGYKVTEDNKIIFTKSGSITVKAQTSETEEYASASKDITVDVLDTVSVDAKGAKPHVFYKLNKQNCECVMSIQGVKEAEIPQSFAYNDGKYVVSYVAYITEEYPYDTQRTITFGDGKKVYEPEIYLGHCNGTTFAKGRYYVVQGRNKAFTTFDESFKDYKAYEFPDNVSGIAYDETTDMFYTSDRSGMTAYSSDFSIVNTVARVKHKSKHYCQDCAAYGGILMHCVSGEGYVGTNYIDFYDMVNSKYLGTIECQLSEVESIIVDDEGYIELLGNEHSITDYIWKTPVNIKKICD